MKNLLLLGLWASAHLMHLEGSSTRTVFIPRSWYDVGELIKESQMQTGIPLTLEAEDTMGKMVLYDNLTDLASVKEAVLEYYQYVLGLQVKWFKDGRGWLLREGTAVELGLAKDLMKIEELWLEATARGAFEFLDLPPEPKKPAPIAPEPVIEKVIPDIVASTDGEAKPATHSPDEPVEEKVSEKKEKVVEKRAPYWLADTWRRILRRLEEGGELERERIRRAMRDEDLMGHVPLMELWLGKSLKEFLMEPGSYVDSRPTLGMVRGAGDLGVLSPSTQVTAEKLPANASQRKLDELPVIDGPRVTMFPDSDLEQLDDLLVGGGRKVEKRQKGFLDRDDLVSTIPQRRFPQTPYVAFKWPRHIVTLTSKSWWESFWRRTRPKHQVEKKMPPPSRRALQRRDEASQTFDRWADWNQERRALDTNRRGEGL